jgi:hypothetical protein
MNELKSLSIKSLRRNVVDLTERQFDLFILDRVGFIEVDLLEHN